MRFKLSKRAQSTAEYAITIGVVVAIVAGIMSVTLKSGMRKKHTEGALFLQGAGNVTGGTIYNPDGSASSQTVDSDVFGSGASLSQNGRMKIFETEARRTVVDSNSYVDRKILHKGGRAEQLQAQLTNTTSVTIDHMGEVDSQ